MSIGTDKPTCQLLLKYVRDHVAASWNDLGVVLLREESTHQLNNIRANYHNDIRKCCSELFDYWLSTDTECNWYKLMDALKEIHQDAFAAKIKADILKGN